MSVLTNYLNAFSCFPSGSALSKKYPKIVATVICCQNYFVHDTNLEAESNATDF